MYVYTTDPEYNPPSRLLLRVLMSSWFEKLSRVALGIRKHHKHNICLWEESPMLNTIVPRFSVSNRSWIIVSFGARATHIEELPPSSRRVLVVYFFVLPLLPRSRVDGCFARLRYPGLYFVGYFAAGLRAHPSDLRSEARREKKKKEERKKERNREEDRGAMRSCSLALVRERERGRDRESSRPTESQPGPR